MLPEILGRWAVNLVQLSANKKRRCHVPPLFSERVEEELDPPRWPLRKEDKCSQERMKKRWGKGKRGTSGCCQVPHPRGFWRGPSRPSSQDTACPALARPGQNRSGRGSPGGDEPGSRGKGMAGPGGEGATGDSLAAGAWSAGTHCVFCMLFSVPFHPLPELSVHGLKGNETRQPVRNPGWPGGQRAHLHVLGRAAGGSPGLVHSLAPLPLQKMNWAGTAGLPPNTTQDKPCEQ